MGTISSSIKLDDRMTPAIKSMLNGMNAMIAGFERMESASGDAIDTKTLKYARNEMARASASFQQFEKSVNDANNEQKKFNNTARNAGSSISGLAGKIGTLAGAYVGLRSAQSIIEMADSYSQTTARLNLMNDGLQTTKELQDQIFEAANDSYSSYDSMADMVGKLGLMAGDAFSDNGEIVDFAEQVSKQFVISGASASEASNAMLQLTQAMASGVLRGDELNSIYENSSTLIQSIADYLQVPIGSIREMASEGEITADVIKKALASTAISTDEKFEVMGKTFGQAWTVFQNKSGRAFQGVNEDLNALANSDGLDTFLNGLAGGVSAVGDILSGEGIGKEGIVGTLSGVADSAKMNFVDATTVISQHSGEISAAFDTTFNSWDNLFTSLSEGTDILAGKSLGEWFGGEFVKTVEDIANFGTEISLAIPIVKDFMGLIFATPDDNFDGYGSSAAQWSANLEKLNGDLEKHSQFMQQVQEDRDRLNAELNTVTFYKPIEEMYSAGYQGMEGYIQGIQDSRPTVEKSSAELAKYSVDAVNDELDINSPSKVFKEIGQYVGDGLVLGLKDRERSIKAGGDSAATALKESFKDALGIHSPSTVFRDLGYYAMDGLIQGLNGTDMLSFSNGIVSDIQTAFAKGNFNLQVGTEFLGDGAAEFFKSIGVGGTTVEGLIKPVGGTVTSGFGWREPEMTASGEYSSSYHAGLDIGAAWGTPVGAAGAGEVDYAGWYGGYGNTVMIDHGNGLETLYGHLSSILTSIGQMVSAGDIIGLVGSTGNSTGPHLHFGIYQNGEAIDPSALYGYSSGTLSARPGLHLVGENGPELMGFNGGETVLNSKKTKNLLNYSDRGSGSGGGSNYSPIELNFNGDININSEMDVKRFGRILAAELNDARIRTPNVSN